MKHESGQIGLIVLLIMVVVVTIAVSVSTRSVSELRISRQEQESTRSLDLAESGIEDLLSRSSLPVGSGVIPIAGRTVSYNVTPNFAIGSTVILQGHTLELDITGASSLGFTLDAAAGHHAVVVALVNSDNSLSRNVYCNKPGCSGNINNVWGGSTAIGASGKLARIKALFADVTLNNVQVTGGTNPVYHTINSTAQMDDGTTRTVQVNKFPGSLPSIFDYVLFSGTSLEKN